MPTGLTLPWFFHPTFIPAGIFGMPGIIPNLFDMPGIINSSLSRDAVEVLAPWSCTKAQIKLSLSIRMIQELLCSFSRGSAQICTDFKHKTSLFYGYSRIIQFTEALPCSTVLGNLELGHCTAGKVQNSPAEKFLGIF